jgi:large subunit ribosomal protein L37Ae
MLNTAKYGRKIRNLFNSATKNKNSGFECPKCGKAGKMKRISFAVWECKSCGATVAGGAYQLTTEAGNTMKRVLSATKR